MTAYFKKQMKDGQNWLREDDKLEKQRKPDRAVLLHF